MQAILRILCFSMIGLSSTTLVCLGRYIYRNKTNHTGMDPWLAIPIFIASLLIGLMAFRADGKSRKLPILLLLLGVVGIAALFAVDHFNIMLEYNKWLKRGMPEKPFWASNQQIRVNPGRAQPISTKPAEANSNSKAMSTPADMLRALQVKDWARVKALVNENPQLLTVHDADGYAPLHIAVEENQSETVRFLIAAGADVNAKTGTGLAVWNRTPLHLAAFGGHATITKILLDSGADPNAKSSVGNTPLHRAALYGGNEDVAKLLLEHGADVDPRESTGSTPLHMALAAEHGNVVLVLLANGADVNAKDHKGTSPLHSAYNEQIAAALLAKGANLHAVCGDGYTPLSMAEKQERPGVADLLRKHGAK